MEHPLHLVSKRKEETVPEYLLSVHHVGELVPRSEEEMQATFKRVGEFNEVLQERGSWVFAGGLEMPQSAKTIDPRSGEPLVTDGPFSESKEFLGGFWVINAKDMEEAMELATQGAMACGDVVEVRAFQQVPD